VEDASLKVLSSNNILTDGDTSSSNCPLRTDQINARRKPEATKRLAIIRMIMTLNEKNFSNVSA
jgi:hypothetical protein